MGIHFWINFKFGLVWVELRKAKLWVHRFFYKDTKNIKLAISKAIRVFESPYYVFGNLSFLSIYSEVLGYALLCETLDRTVFPTLWLLDPRNWIELNSFLLFFHLTFESSIFMAMTLRKMSWLKLIKLKEKTTQPYSSMQ